MGQGYHQNVYICVYTVYIYIYIHTYGAVIYDLLAQWYNVERCLIPDFTLLFLYLSIGQSRYDQSSIERVVRLPSLQHRKGLTPKWYPKGYPVEGLSKVLPLQSQCPFAMYQVLIVTSVYICFFHWLTFTVQDYKRFLHTHTRCFWTAP